MYISQIIASDNSGKNHEKALRQGESPKMGLAKTTETQGNSGRRISNLLDVFWITVTLGQGMKKCDGGLTCPRLEGAYLIVTNNSGKQRGLRMAYGCGKITPCSVPRSLKGLG